MHSSRRPAPRPLRRPLASAATPTSAAAPPVVWEQAAAAATVLARNAQGGQINVQVLCWPIVPTAWALLQQALQLVQASRMSVGRDSGGDGAARSWVGESAPQLSQPFRDTAAEESSVAALLARTPLQFSVGLATAADLSAPEALAVARRQSLTDCLAGYGESLRVPGRSPVRRLLVAGDADAELEQDLDVALKRARLRLDDSDALRGLRVQRLTDTPALLPLEAAGVVARAVAEHLRGGESVHAILDVAVAKLMRVPPELARDGKPRQPRRR